MSSPSQQRATIRLPARALRAGTAVPASATPIGVGLIALLKAYNYARELERPAWDFAIEIDSLHALGLTNADLRWLVCKGYVEHAVETTPPRKKGRVFRRVGNLTFTAKTCFVLTDTGAVCARNSGDPLSSIGSPETHARINSSALPVGSRRPHWDGDRRELYVGSRLVKQFKVPAENQELILCAFEEEGWPPHLDDPLPPRPEMDSKRRLHDAINRLNHNQKHRLIRFHGDGHGQGLAWEFIGRIATRLPPDCH